MSRLQELIKELCPDGVKYVKLGNVCSIEKGKTPIQKAISGDYPLVVTTSERKSCNSFQFDCSAVCIPLVSSRGHGVASLNHVYYQSGKFALGNILCAVIPNDENELNAFFLYNYLEYKKDSLLVPLMKGGANVSLHIDDIERVKIPLPPFPVQEEISRILDNFTELTTELENELADRRKQYEYYRDMLLRFDEANSATHTHTHTHRRFREVKRLELREVCDIKGRIGFRGYTRNDMVDKGKGAISLSPANIVNSTIQYGDDTYISWEKYDESPEIMVQINDILLCKTGSTVGKTAIVDYLPDKATINPQLVVLKNVKCDNRFLKYVLTTFYFQSEIQKRKGLGSVPNISQKEIGSIKVPIPPIEEQQRIVSILDRFDKLCNDISEGLPAEITARRKQYEYYRDKLLTFDIKE